MRTPRLNLALLVTALLGCPVWAQNTPEVDRLFARWDTDDAPGCAVAVVRDGELQDGVYPGEAIRSQRAEGNPQ